MFITLLHLIRIPDPEAKCCNISFSVLSNFRSLFLCVAECEICPEYPCQYFHHYGCFIYALFEKVSLFAEMGSVYEHILYPNSSMTLILTISEGDQGILVGCGARILLCERYYRYTRVHPGVVTTSPAALSVAFTHPLHFWCP